MGEANKLWRIFKFGESGELFEKDMADDAVLDVLRAEAETAINNTENIIRKRIDQLGVAQPNVQKLSFSGRILVELPGIDDPARARKQLKSTANLEFWETGSRRKSSSDSATPIRQPAGPWPPSCTGNRPRRTAP